MNRDTVRPLDYHFGQYISRGLAPDDQQKLAMAGALVSSALGRKEVCLHLDTLTKEVMAGVEPPDDWTAWLLGSGRVSTPDQPDQALVLDGQRLYLSRYWHYESQLAEMLLARASQSHAIERPEETRASLDLLFPASYRGEPDQQKLAVALALHRSLLIISGGPGTGKTHTVAAIIALLLAQNPRLRIGLAAPTGKAAARLGESMRQFKTREHGRLGDETLALMPDEAKTLHRLLGMRPGRVAPRHGPENPLHLDVLVVDESSMIDLPLMHKTLAALPSDARLILLGDKDQLASVEAGSVYADLCGLSRENAYDAQSCRQLAALGIDEVPQAKGRPGAIDQCRVQLIKSHRFDAGGGIGQLASAVRDGQEQEALALLESKRLALHWQSLKGSKAEAFLVQQAEQGFAALMQAKSPQDALKALDGFRILCALRQGNLGVEGINPLVERHLRSQGLIATTDGQYRGRPLLIGRNDANLGLFNGDIGVLWPDEQGQLRAWFQQADGSLKALLPNRLPAHETAYALSIHKAQGSEFTRVLLVLPDNPDNPLLTRELLYTGISRAREQVGLLASAEVIRAALARQVKRASGLGERLRFS